MDKERRLAMKTRFDIIANSYEKAISLYPEARKDHIPILQMLDLSGKETVFETTAGTGFLTVKLASLLVSGKLTVHDISRQMIGFSRKKIKKLGLCNVHYYLTKNMSLPKIPDCTMDKAVCFGGFHHVEEPIKLFKSVRRILKPGGTFAVGDFADSSPVQGYFDIEIHKKAITGHKALFLSPSQMLNFARFAGFSVLSLERKTAPFIFPSVRDVGIFYSMVHQIDQTWEECADDIGRYMGILQAGNSVIVPMDYIYALYRKEG